MSRLAFIKSAALGAVLMVSSTGAMAADTYWTDQGHTEVRFGWSHAGVSNQTGEFTKASGKLMLDPKNVEKSSITVKIDTASVATGFEPLDKHLKSKDFLEVEKYPEITFESTSVKKTGDKTADVTGKLTMHGVTKEITLKTELTHLGAHPLGSSIDYYKGKWVAFAATAELKAKDYGVGPYPTGTIKIWISTELKDREK